MVWDIMSFHGFPDLHIEHRGRTVTSDFRVDDVMKETAASAMRRRTESGPPTPAKLLPDMFQAIFQQDGVPAHPPPIPSGGARSTSLPFWVRRVWLGYSPDLSPIENLLAIVQDKVDMMDPANSEAILIRTVRSARRSIPAQTLDNLNRGMPERMRAYMEKCGDFINK